MRLCDLTSRELIAEVVFCSCPAVIFHLVFLRDAHLTVQFHYICFVELLLHGTESMKAHSPPPRLTAWVIESNTPLERATKELEHVQQHLNKLSSIFDQLDTVVDNEVSVEARKPKFTNEFIGVYLNSSDKLVTISSFVKRVRHVALF